MAALILAMIAATVFEKFKGTEATMAAFYHSWWFIALWAVAAVGGVVLLLERGVQKKVWIFTLHLSFVLILAGALVTHLSGEEGEVKLSPDIPVNEWQDADDVAHPLPGTLTLERFEVMRYTGSMAASDYRSTVHYSEPSGESGAFVISMNNIAKWKGWRLYQADFGKDGSSVLAVSHDPWGIGLTYAGYLVLLLSMIGFFFQKGSAYRATLRRVMQASAFLLVFLLPSKAQAKRLPGDTPKVLPEEVAEAFDGLYVYYNDRICPFETLARNYTMKAYGKPRWNDFSATQVVTGWLFYYDWWQVVPFKVKAKDRGTVREREKEYLQRSTASGDAWKLFPVVDSTGTPVWHTANDMLPLEVIDDEAKWTFIRKVLDVVEEEVRAENWDEVIRVVGKIRAYQEKTAAAVLPSPAHLKAEKLYNRIARPRVPFMASITLGLVLFILSGIRLSRGKRLRGSHLLAVVAIVLWLYLTLALGLRWYVSGHAPFAGTYCVMMLMAWLSCIVMVLLYRKFPLIQPLGFILAGFTMLQASISGGNPQITHLMPVLNSPLLSIHVLSMMLSYTLFGLVALNGIMGLIVPAEASSRLRDVSLVVLTPAVFLITFGTFLGAVWANISWGIYWGWDPKETWALITLLIYAAALHGGVMSPFRRPRFFHAYCILAFLAMLTTYFGVNLILGGMHAYA